MNIQGLFPLGLTGLISFLFKGFSRIFSNRQHEYFGTQPSLWSTSYIIHDYWKTIALPIWPFVGIVMSLLFKMLSRFVTAFLPRNKHLLISWLKSWSSVTLETNKRKSVTASTFPHLFIKKWWERMPWSSFFDCWALSQLFHSPLSLSSRGSFASLRFLPWGWCICISEVAGISRSNLDYCLCFLQPGISHDVLCV